MNNIVEKEESDFEGRMRLHDELENKIMKEIRNVTDRKHLPDRRVSFHDEPVSFDVKTTPNVEDKAHDEYFRLVNEGEKIFIVYQDYDGKLLANWITELKWSNLKPTSINSTCGDDYYTIIGGGMDFHDFLFSV